ncbi:MAG: dTDP-4-dehydrorhamnose reductase [Pseudomonadota bacterium]
MTLLVFGQTGQVAQDLARQASDAIFAGRDIADLEDPASCVAAIEETAPSAVVNAAAYTAVDKAEEEEAKALRINAVAPGAMAEACAARGIPFVHISTDYVFDGGGATPWGPGDDTAPLGAYGRTKLAGEDAVRQAGGTHAILRTSWVFSAHGSNFVKTMLRLGHERDEIAVVADQVGGPTAARDIANACLRIAAALQATPERSGTYHFSGAPNVSWAGFAREVFAQAGIGCTVSDIASADYPTPARRPMNSRLDNAATHAAFGIARPDWRASLSEVLEELK